MSDFAWILLGFALFELLVVAIMLCYVLVVTWMIREERRRVKAVRG
jgi:hypothetical protein